MADVASWALQRSVFQALAGSSGLTMLLGCARIYDDAPQGASFPYVTLGQSVMRDWKLAKAWMALQLGGKTGGLES